MAHKTKAQSKKQTLKRRDFLRNSAGAMASTWLSAWPWQKIAAQESLRTGTDDWDAGLVRHLLPAVNETRFLIKVSFTRPLKEQPRLQIRSGSNRQSVEGHLNDTIGEFWQFYATNLKPDTQYELSIQDSSGSSLCETWP